jgi:trehalose-phosphatase
MAAIAEHFSKDVFFNRLARSPNSALVIDYDETIWLFSANRRNSSLPEILHVLATTGGTRVVVMSDLRAMQVAALLQMSPAPEIWGAQGLERRSPSGDCEVIDPHSAGSQALAAMDLSLEEEGLGQLTEIHPGSLILRWNNLGCRVAEEVRERVSEAWSAVRSEWLNIRQFEGGIEFRASSWSKGQAVAHLLNEMGASIPVAYLGDEKSDQDVFRTLKHKGLCVLVQPRFVASLADVWLQSLDDVLGFLGDWLRARAGDMALT